MGWRKTDRPIDLGYSTITCEVTGGPSLHELADAVGYHPNNENPRMDFPFSVCLHYFGGRPRVMHDVDILVRVVAVHRIDQSGVELKCHLVDRGDEGVFSEFYRTMDPRLAPDVVFGNYRITGKRQGSVTFQKATYERLVCYLVSYYADDDD